MDYHFFIEYYVNITKESQLFVRFGRTLMNRGSNYNLKSRLFTENGSFDIISEQNFNYQPMNFGFGFHRNKLDVFLGVYTSKDTEYYDYPNRITVPYFKVGYYLHKL